MNRMKGLKVKYARFVSMWFIALVAYAASKWLDKYHDLYPEDVGLDTDWI